MFREAVSWETESNRSMKINLFLLFSSPTDATAETAIQAGTEQTRSIQALSEWGAIILVPKLSSRRKLVK